MIYIGIDPGYKGGIALIDDDNHAYAYKMPSTEMDIYQLIRDISLRYNDEYFALLEKVHSMPQQGVKSTFTFGMHYGFLRACLMACSIPFDDISPAKWQRKLNCLSRGDKNITKAKAQQLFPELKITHYVSDALLIAYYNKNFYSRR